MALNAEARTPADSGTRGSASVDRHLPKVGSPVEVEGVLELGDIVLIDMELSFADAPASHFHPRIAWVLARAFRPYGPVLGPFMGVLVYE